MDVELQVREGVARITLNRPQRRNAITGPLGIALAEAFEQVQQDASVRAVLFSGSGGSFCSGLDLSEFNASPKPDWMARWPAIWRRAHSAIFACEKPIVGALERYAINGGAALIIACDFAIAGESAFLQVGEVQLGMAAPYNLAWLTMRHGDAVCARLALLGDRVSGPDLERLGVVHESVTDEQVLARADELASRLAAYPDGAAARIKRGLRAASGIDMQARFERAWAAAAGSAPPPAPPGKR